MEVAGAKAARIATNNQPSATVLYGGMMKATTILVAAVLLLGGAAAHLAYGDRAGEGDQPEKNVVTVNGMSYSPARMTISVGETVTWKNTDERDHSIKAEDSSFDSGTIRSGGTFRHRFTRAGTYNYACAFHPREKGVIVVE
jgi:plastocyanin